MSNDLPIIAVTGRFGHALQGRVSALLGPVLAGRSAIIDAYPSADPIRFSDVTDDMFEDMFVTPALDLAMALQSLPAECIRILLIGSVSYLGDWHRVPSACFGGFAIGMMRSLALERMSEGVSINMIALPADEASLSATWVDDMAPLAAALLASSSVSGHVVPFDGGANLRMTKARNQI